jgi:hypothetical protein
MQWNGMERAYIGRLDFARKDIKPTNLLLKISRNGGF